MGHVNTPAFLFLVILLKVKKVCFVLTQLRRKARKSNREYNQLLFFPSDVILSPSVTPTSWLQSWLCLLSLCFILFSYLSLKCSCFQGLVLRHLLFSAFSAQVILPVSMALDIINMLTILRFVSSAHTCSLSAILRSKNSPWFLCYSQICPSYSVQISLSCSLTLHWGNTLS